MADGSSILPFATSEKLLWEVFHLTDHRLIGFGKQWAVVSKQYAAGSGQLVQLAVDCFSYIPIFLHFHIHTFLYSYIYFFPSNLLKTESLSLPLMKAGFVSIVGKPNAGKSTLLNALLGEKLAIVSPKAQTTRHRIKGILGNPDYQIVFSDTPGMIQPQYKLHEKMMDAVRQSLEDADLVLLLADVRDDPAELGALFHSLQLSMPAILVVNKSDLVAENKLREVVALYEAQPFAKAVVPVSALRKAGIDQLLAKVIHFLPEGEPFFGPDELTDLPTKFFVAELIREQIFFLFKEEIPYHTTVVVKEFKEKTTLVKIVADIIVHRESQKGIILGEGGKMIRELGTLARQEIEKFLGQKVFLELFVKVRPKWRDSEGILKEYGYI